MNPTTAYAALRHVALLGLAGVAFGVVVILALLMLGLEWLRD